MGHRAIVVGGSGLIGRLLINILLEAAEYDEVICLGRKKLNTKNGRLTQFVVDFDRLEDYTDKITGDVIFCCLGTTKDKTPDVEQYRRIDHDYPVRLAKIAKANDAQQFHFVSSIGANPESSTFYTKLKGETESDLQAVAMHTLFIYRPSLLIGERREKRRLEKYAVAIMKILSPLMIGRLKKYRPIAAKTVAEAMYKQSLKHKKAFIYTRPIK